MNARDGTVLTPGVKLSVVVCTFNRADLLGECLISLVGQGLSSEQFEVLVVDNNSSDNTCDLVHDFMRRYGQIRYLSEKRQGLSVARNRGWQEARGAYVAFLDDDATAAPDWCERILMAFTSIRPAPVAVGGPILPRLNRTPPWWYDARLETRTWGETPCFLRPPLALFGFSGSNMAIRKQALYGLSGFRTSLGMHGRRLGMGEETDLFYRLYKTTPFFWYDPEIKVYHLVAESKFRIRCRVFRSFKAGQSRRAIDRRSLSPGAYLRELAGIVFVFRDVFREKDLNFSFVFISLLERVANRLGYIDGRTE